MIYTIVRADTTTISLDCVQQFSEGHSATATQHPVESGSTITDHVFLNNSEFQIRGVVSDYSPSPDYITMSGLADATTNENARSHTTEIKELLMAIFRGRERVTIHYSASKFSEAVLFENCVMTSIGFSDDTDSGEAIYPELKFSQIRVVNKQTRQEASVPDFLATNAQKTTNADGTTSTTVDAKGNPVVKPTVQRRTPEHNDIVQANFKSRLLDYNRVAGFPIPLATTQAATDMGAKVNSDGTLAKVGGRIVGDDAFDTSTVLKSQAQVVSKSVAGTTQTAVFDYAKYKVQQGIVSKSGVVQPTGGLGSGVLRNSQ